MSSRAVRQFRARNPNQHQLLTGLVVDRQINLLERGAKLYMRGASPVLEVGDGEERGRAKRRTRGGKTVTWSKTLLQVSVNTVLDMRLFPQEQLHENILIYFSDPGAQHQSSATSTSSLASSSTSISFSLVFVTEIRHVASVAIVAALTNEITVAASNSTVDKQRQGSASFLLATHQCGTPSPASAAAAAKEPQPQH